MKDKKKANIVIVEICVCMYVIKYVCVYIINLYDHLKNIADVVRANEFVRWKKKQTVRKRSGFGRILQATYHFEKDI